MTLRGDRHELLLLDTNVLVHVARGDDIGSWIVDEYELMERYERPLLSTVVEAEIRAFAGYQGWGSRRLELLADMLAELVRIEVDRAPIIDSYVALYCIARRSGQAIWQSNQNDLWIAATARATGAALLTQDTDFEFLHPEHIRVETVPIDVP